MTYSRAGGRWRWPALAAVVVVLAALAFVATPSTHGGAGATETLAGSAGIVTGLPPTPSQVTVSGTGSWSNLHITVNQTQELVNQAVSVSWTGGVPTYSNDSTGFAATFAGDYLQMFECWSDQSATDPSPEQCEFGGESDNPATYPADAADQVDRVVALAGADCPAGSPPGCQSYTQAQAIASSDASQVGVGNIRYYLNPDGEAIMDPFDAVDGTIVPLSVNADFENTIPYTAYNQNPYYSFTTSNEVDFARTNSDGTGTTIFQADTGLQAPGLGCGQQGDPASKTEIPKCWLVVVPRGTAAQENQDDSGVYNGVYVATSPLNPIAWANHIAIPLSFEPIATACTLGSNETRIVGGELAARASASWQPTLCAIPGVQPYAYGAVGDDSARQQLEGIGTGGTAGMAVVSDPPATGPSTPPMVYAPLTLSGAVIGFNIERIPTLVTGGVLSPAEIPYSGTHVATLNLTPRLVAKLLTESYKGQFFPNALVPQSYNAAAYAWLANNPKSLVTDPDFLQYNPEFSQLDAADLVDGSGMVFEEQSSDAIAALWQWIMGDPAAEAWLAGQRDPWGMQVNPYYNTTLADNPSGSAFDNPPIDNIPKSDPYCWIPVGYEVGSPPVQARNLCFQDWTPYVATDSAAAAATRAANSGAKNTFDLGASDPDTAWGANGPQPYGQNFMLSVTTTDQAFQFGLQTANLSQDGDDGQPATGGPSPTFIPPDTASMLAAEGSMTAGSVPGFLQPNPTTTATGAYPLTLLSYAVLEPTTLTPAEQTAYAAYISYAVGPGQVPGTAYGNLPFGYVPLPSGLVTQAQQAAAAIVDPPSPTTTTTEAPSVTTTAAPTTTTLGDPAGAVTATTSPPITTTATTAAPAVTPPPSGAPTPENSPQPQNLGTSPVESPTRTPVTSSPAVVHPTGEAQGASPRTVVLPRAQLATLRQRPTVVGLVRFAVPVGLLLGLAAALGAFFIGRRKARGGTV